MKITLQNLTKKFPARGKKERGEVVAVNDFNFEIPDGELVGLLGPSGCGKSTTLNLICGLLKPTAGKIFFGEDDVTGLPPENRGVGLVFQSYALYPHLTVEQNIRFPLENLKGPDKLSKEKMREKVYEAAKLVQIEGLMERRLVLNHIDSTLGKQEAVVRSKIEKFNLSQSASLEVFAPTFVSVVNIGGKCVRTEHPLTFHYVFVKGTFDAVKKLCGMAGGFSFVFNHGGAGRYAILADRQMEDFRTIARAYQNRLPFFYIDDVDLEAGDKVEVVEGDFPGLVGYFIPNAKSTTGNIVLQVTQSLATIAYNINVKSVRVLEFSKKSRRSYDQIDAFVPKLYGVLRKFNQGTGLAAKEIGELTVFCRRMGIVRSGNSKFDAKLSAILAAAHHILGNHDEAAEAARRFEKLKNAITSDAAQALVLLLEAVVKNDSVAFRSGKEALGQTVDKTSQALVRLRAEYEFYNDYFGIA